MTLTELSYYLRRFVPLVAFTVVVFGGMFIGVNMYLKSQEKPVVRVFTPAFGKLPALQVMNAVPYPPSPEFKLENIIGRPVTSTDSARVMYIPPTVTRLGYVTQLTLMGQAAGFETQVDGYTLNGLTARYENPERSLTVDITNFNFTYELNYQAKPEIFDTATIPKNEDTAKEGAKAYLRKMGKYTSDLSRGYESVLYLRYDTITDTLQVVPDSSQANVVEVGFFRENIDALTAVSETFYKSHNYVIMVFSAQNPETPIVIKSQVKYFDKDAESAATYPLKTGDEAWAELISGRGAIVSAGQNTNQITVRDMYVGYYDPTTYMEYLQPVYVFLGDNNFAAYVPAVKSEYTDGVQLTIPTP